MYVTDEDVVEGGMEEADVPMHDTVADGFSLVEGKPHTCVDSKKVGPSEAEINDAIEGKIQPTIR